MFIFKKLHLIKLIQFRQELCISMPENKYVKTYKIIFIIYKIGKASDFIYVYCNKYDRYSEMKCSS